MGILTSRPPRKCLNPSCFEFGNWVGNGGYCPKHTRISAGVGRSRPLEKLYRCAMWLHRFRPRFIQLNPVCQRIENGVRCTAMTNQLHHLVEPRTTEQFFNPKNVVGLCREHHAPWPGTPYWVEGKDYAPTVWNLPSFGQEA